MNAAVRVFVGVGANLGDRQATIRSACDALSEHEACSKLRCSSLYETSPMGPADQPDYVNAVVELYTGLSAQAFLQLLQSIENEHGRLRDGTRWGARTLDLDILLFGSEVIKSDNLVVPHPGIPERSFVLIPLAELAPTLILPTFGPIGELLANCSQFDIRRLNSSL